MNDPVRIGGYASVFNYPYAVGDFTEVIKPGAFARTLARTPRVHLLTSHAGLPLASTDNGSLNLREDSVGLKVDAVLDPDDPDSAAAARKVNSGLLREMSFAFRVDGPDGQEWNSDYSVRTITAVDIDRGDVSVVPFGASDGTSVKVDGTTDPPMLGSARGVSTLEDRRARAQRVGRQVVIVESRGFGIGGTPSHYPSVASDRSARMAALSREADANEFMRLQRAKLAGLKLEHR